MLLIATTETVIGRTISGHLGVVCGNTVRAKHVGRAIAASLKTLIGGEVRGYTEMLSESRNQAVERMIQAGQELGADAIVNVRFTTSMVQQGMAEMLAYGTAVKLS